jgi:hypothetical protein
VFAACSTVAIACFWTVVWYFGKHNTDETFWMDLHQLRRKIALFSLTVLYFPVCQCFVDVLRCSDTGNSGFGEIGCMSGFRDLQLVHLAAILFGVTYMVAIPFFFTKLIQDGVNRVYLNFQIDQDLRTLEELSHSFRKKRKEIGRLEEIDFEASLEEKQKEIDDRYAVGCHEFDTPAQYLYSHSKRNSPYEKVGSMIQKVALLLIRSFAPTLIMHAMVGGLSVLFLLWQLVRRPYSATNENVLEGSGRVVAVFSLAIGETLQYQMLQAAWFIEYAAPALLIGVVVILFVIFIVIITRAHVKCCRNREKEDDSEDYSTSDYPVLQPVIVCRVNPESRRALVTGTLDRYMGERLTSRDPGTIRPLDYSTSGSSDLRDRYGSVVNWD